MGALLPGLADQLRTPIRWIGTPLSDNCLLNQFKRMSEWRSRIYPVKFLNAAEEWQATWPAKHPLEDIERIERSYIEAGNHREFVQEYMCESESRTEVLFRREMFHYDASRVRTYQALYAMVDPARTTKKNSAMTGWAVWSWDPGARLTIWEANGGYLKPDEVVSLLFDLQERWGLVEIGIEEDGLNEWAMQPIRDAQTRRGVIPVRPMRAPRGKIDFIRGLQPYFSATRNVTMVGGEAEFRTLTQQLMAFPRDLMDVPNALAYALLMRPGEVVFPDFSPEAIFEDEAPLPMEPLYLAMNADGQRVTGVLLQEARGVVRVFADLVADGQPGDIAADIIREAIRFAGAETRNGRAISRVRVVVGPQHGETYRNHGLVQAVARATGQAPVFGVQAAEVGRQAVREALQRRVRGVPGLMVSSDAAWVLRGLTGGFAYAVEKNGGNAQEPLKGVYRTLLEGLESGVGMANLASQAEDAPGSFRTTDDGRRYRTALRR
jgi:hypothetical protein